MALRVHAFVQNADDLDDFRVEGAIKDNVDGIDNRRFAARKSAMANVKAAYSTAQVAAIDR